MKDNINLKMLKREKRSIYSKARYRGEVLKGNLCYVCGDSDKVQGHHPDLINKPLFIISLCHTCHLIIHKRDPLRTLRLRVIRKERKELLSKIRLENK